MSEQDTTGLAGAATEAGTLRGAESFGAGARTLGRTKLHVTPIGFGGYRIADGSPVHRRALADALRGGVNLIDTSTNYTGGASERLVGRIVANLVQRGEVRRDQVVVVSKVGYIQGENLARVRARETPYPDVVPYADNLWHCIAPQFVCDQLDESLQRLGLAKLDVLLLHNPEYALMHAAKHGEDLQAARAELESSPSCRLRGARAGGRGWQDRLVWRVVQRLLRADGCPRAHLGGADGRARPGGCLATNTTSR